MSKYYCLKEAPRLVKLGSSDSFQLDLHCFLYMARKGGEGEEGSGSPGLENSEVSREWNLKQTWTPVAYRSMIINYIKYVRL